MPDLVVELEPVVDRAQNVNFALKTEVARTFLDSKGIAYRKAPSDRQLSRADVGDIARPFTVYTPIPFIGEKRLAGAWKRDSELGR